MPVNSLQAVVRLDAYIVFRGDWDNTSISRKATRFRFSGNEWLWHYGAPSILLAIIAHNHISDIYVMPRTASRECLLVQAMDYLRKAAESYLNQVFQLLARSRNSFFGIQDRNSIC